MITKVWKFYNLEIKNKIYCRIIYLCKIMSLQYGQCLSTLILLAPEVFADL